MEQTTTLFYKDSAQQTLIAMLSNGRFPHAVLLEGPRGVGKRTFATHMAAALLCGDGGFPCKICDVCHKVFGKNHPDVIYLGGEGGARSFHIDVVRELRQDAYIRPNEAERKVYILENVGDMTVQAQNALLKLIEEPPSYAVFILTVENRSALLATILSRVQIVPIPTVDADQCLEALRALCPDKGEDDLRAAAEACGGSIGAGLELLDEENQNYRVEAIKVLRLAAGPGEYQLLKALAAYERDRPGFLRLLAEMKQVLSEETVLVASGKSPKNLPALPLLQMFSILDIIEATAGKAVQNGNLALLTTSLSSGLKRPASGSI